MVKLVGQHTHELEVETMADILIEQGVEQGIEQGKTRAKQEALLAAKQEAVLKLLQFQFKDVPESIANLVTSIQSVSRLDALFEEVWEADTLDEIDWQNGNN